MPGFDIQRHLEQMEDRITERFDKLEDSMKEVSELRTRVALLEQSTITIRKGLWWTVTSLGGAIITYVISLFKHT